MHSEKTAAIVRPLAREIAEHLGADWRVSERGHMRISEERARDSFRGLYLVRRDGVALEVHPHEWDDASRVVVQGSYVSGIDKRNLGREGEPGNLADKMTAATKRGAEAIARDITRKILDNVTANHHAHMDRIHRDAIDENNQRATGPRLIAALPTLAYDFEGYGSQRKQDVSKLRTGLRVPVQTTVSLSYYGTSVRSLEFSDITPELAEEILSLVAERTGKAPLCEGHHPDGPTPPAIARVRVTLDDYTSDRDLCEAHKADDVRLLRREGATSEVIEDYTKR